jgi:hypothetical protein
LHPKLIKLIGSWLDDRSSIVVVNGSTSVPSPLRNSVYQGTVWGPPLWNCHYEDSRCAVNVTGFTETVFADDLNCFKEFDVTVPEDELRQAQMKCQQSLHQWGEANQVIFDPGKESFHVLHPRSFSGSNFHMLGVTFDPQLTMDRACYEIAAVASTRLRTLLRVKRFHSTRSMVRQYKSQILSSIDCATSAIYHSPAFFLQVLDRVQNEFIAELSLTPLDALLDYNLAPLCIRRDISMLGLLHRVSLGVAPPQFRRFIYPARQDEWNRGWAYNVARHTKQIHDPIDGTTTRMMERSVLGLVYTYNSLTQRVVDLKDVSRFQHALQDAVKACARAGSSDWELLLKQGARANGVASFHKWFNAN